MEFNFLTSLMNAAKLSLKLILVITILMIIYEFFENSKWYEKLQIFLKKPLSKIGFTPNSSITMVVGLVLGIAYGAGILISNALSKKMSSKEILLSSLFLAVCHAIFEDTLLFVAIGGNGLIILSVRFLIAILVSLSISKLLWRNL